MTNLTSEQQLRKRVGLTSVVMLGAGSAIGVSIFSVLAPGAKAAGSGLLIAIGIAALPMIVFAIIYSFLSSALPKCGASYEWPRRFIHHAVGFLITWLRILSNVGAIVVLAVRLLIVEHGSHLPLPAAQRRPAGQPAAPSRAA